jgi:O-antigen ligase
MFAANLSGLGAVGYALAGAMVLGAFGFDLSTAAPFTLPKWFYMGLLPAALLVLVSLRHALARPAVLLVPREMVLLAAFAGVACIAAARASSPLASVMVLVQVLQIFVWLALGAWALNVSTVRERFLLGVSVAGAGVSALGLLQWWALDGWLLNGPFEAFAGLPQVDRPASVFGHVNMASEAALLGLVATWAIRPPRKWRRLGPLLRWLATVIAGTFLLVGGSRAAWFGGAMAGTVFLVLRWRSIKDAARLPFGKSWGLFLAAAIVSLVALDAAIEVPGRGGGRSVRPSERVLDLLSLDTGTEHERLVLWQNSLAMWRDAPWLGVGPGNWVVKFPAFARAAATLDPAAYNLQRQPEAAHMDSLQLLCETGLIGFALMALIFISALARGMANVAQAGLVALVFATLGMSVAAYVFQNPFPAAVAWMALGALTTSSGPLLRGDVRAARPWPVVGLCCAMAVVIGLSWDAECDAAHGLQEGRVLRQSLRASAPELAQGIRQRALDALDRAVAARPGDWRLHAERAIALWDLGLMDDALEAFDRTLVINPDFVNALLLKAVLLLERNELEASYDLLRRALFVQPEAPELRFALGRVLESKARESTHNGVLIHAAASQYRQAAASREFMPLARIALARILLAEGGDVSEVLRLLDKAEENAALMPEVLAMIARIREHPVLAAAAPGIEGKGGARVRRVWQRILGLQPGHPEATLELAVDAWWTGSAQSMDATQVLSALEKAQGAGLLPARVHYHRARVFEATERIHEALQEWTWLVRAGVSAWRDDPMGQYYCEEALAAATRLRQRLP